MSYLNKNTITLYSLFLLGTLLWFMPAPEGVSLNAWHLLNIFLVTILGIILSPIPMGQIALISILATVITGTLTLKESLSGFSSDVVWLVVFAFFISLGFVKSNLGSRIAYMLISKFGHTTLGLSYGLVLSELFLSPIIPSVTARGGGIIYPIAHSLAESYTNYPGRAPSKKTGGFLMQVCLQSNVITSTLFVTAIATNPLTVSLAKDAGIEISWLTWAKAAIVPGLINLFLMPLLVYFIYPPHVKHSDSAPQIAKEKLEALGKMKTQEKIMMAIFILLIGLWIFGPTSAFRISATTTALVGVVVLFLTGILKTEDVLGDKAAWHTYIWFATLVMLSSFLSQFGVMTWIGNKLNASIIGIDPFVAGIVLVLIFFYIHYLFASATAHVTVLYPTFLLVMIGLGFPPLFSALVLGFASILSGGITHFGIASSPIFYGAGYMSTKTWWMIGLVVSVLNIAIWASVGSIWWKVIGLW